MYVGRLVEFKGIMILVDAFQALAEEYTDAQLLIAGEGPLTDVIKTRATKTNINNRIKLLSEIPHEPVLERVGEADVLVHPSE